MSFNIPQDKHDGIDFIINNHSAIVGFIKSRMREISECDSKNLDIFKNTAVQGKTFTVHQDNKCNISITIPVENDSDYTMTYPGATILFPVSEDFMVNYHKIDSVSESIVKTELKKLVQQRHYLLMETRISTIFMAK